MDTKRLRTRIISVLLAVCLALPMVSFSAVDSYAAGGKVRYIAHRGLSAKAPENTLAAFTLASSRKGIYGVEFDIWESDAEKSVVTTEVIRDGEGNEQVVTKPAEPLLIVMHDSNIKRTCGVSKKVRTISRKTLGNYTVRKGKNVKRYRGQKIPTAEQALDVIYSGSNGAVPVIELKHRLSGRALEYLFDCIGNRKAVIISFNYGALTDSVAMARKKGVSGNITTMYLIKKLSRKKYSSTALRLKRAGISCVAIKYTYVKKRTVKAFHRKGVQVGVWTLPNKKTARRYKRMGVDYITANGIVF